jgi:tetratricopeptide (TPR) repeat protein/predicted esterase
MSDEPARAATDFETLLAACIECAAADDDAGVDARLAQHPHLAARVREQLARLERLGLLARDAPEPERIGGHRILKRLGRGGMGTVYLAAEEPGGRLVALKLAHLPQLAGADDGSGRRARARFEREASAMARLAHPNVVAIRALGEHEGRPWFSMEHVHGVPLAHLIARLRARGTAPEALTGRDVRAALEQELEELGPPAAGAAESLDDAPREEDFARWCCRVALEVAEALEHAHAAGIVHRDVKPSNILIRPDGRAQVFDFGLAHVEGQSALTRSGDIAGTPYALAPEQIDARRGPVDGRADVWGLGVTLYELLTLRRPFDAAGTAALLRRILDADPAPLRRFHAAVPRALEHVCATALEKELHRRYADMGALRADLGRLLEGRPVRARGAGRARRLARFVRRRPALTAAATLAALLAVGLPLGLIVANAAIREQATRAELAAEEARRQAAANAEVVDYLTDLFRPLGAEDTAVQAGALAMLETPIQELELRFADQPLVRALLLETTGRVYLNLGRPAQALPLYDRALAVRESLQGETHADTVRLLEELARVHLAAGAPDAAHDLCRRVLAALQRPGAADPPLEARVRTTLARALAAAGRNDEAAGELAAALELLSARPARDDEALAVIHETAARVELARGHNAQALEHCEEALAALVAAWLPERQALARVLELVAQLRGAAGDTDGAQAARAAVEALCAAAQPADAAPLPAALRLQTPHRAEYDEAFQAGITALQSRRLADSVAHFEQCLALRPASGVCLYNLACAGALAGRVPEALAWFERAEQAGYGQAPGRTDVMRRDADLERLRGHPRFEAALERMRRNGERLAAYVREPGVHVPAALRGLEGAPLLVVLHADGSTRDAVLAGPWPRVADALGSVLLVPSAPRPLGVAPEAGLAWLDDVEGFARPPRPAEDAVMESLRDYCSRHAVDRRRVLVAGEGSGALLAFDLALRAPGLVRGVLLLQGPALLDDVHARALTAAALGVRVGAWIDPARPVPWTAPGVPPADYAAALAARLAELELTADDAVRLAPWPQDEALATELADALRALAGP